MTLIIRGGILMSIGDFPESLSQAILVGIMLVGRLGVLPSAQCEAHSLTCCILIVREGIPCMEAIGVNVIKRCRKHFRHQEAVDVNVYGHQEAVDVNVIKRQSRCQRLPSTRHFEFEGPFRFGVQDTYVYTYVYVYVYVYACVIIYYV